MGRKLPPFAALRAFEAAARHGALQAAADELLVSASAVSHQIKALESFIGATLFQRDGRGLSLTELGRGYLAEAGGALDQIEAATVRAMGDRQGGTLRIHLYHSLSQLWLVPRLAEFLGANPDLDIEMITMPDDLDLAGTDIDLAFRYGAAPPLGFTCDKLFDEVMTPVCALGFLESIGPVTRPEDLIGHRLITSAYHDDEWPQWFAAQGVTLAPGSERTVPRLLFDSRASMLQAASEGLGIALNRRPYGDHFLRQGTLVEPLDRPVTTGMAYYLVIPKRAETLPRVKSFRGWLLSLCTVWQTS